MPRKDNDGALVRHGPVGNFVNSGKSDAAPQRQGGAKQIGVQRSVSIKDENRRPTAGDPCSKRTATYLVTIRKLEKEVEVTTKALKQMTEKFWDQKTKNGEIQRVMKDKDMKFKALELELHLMKTQYTFDQRQQRKNEYETELLKDDFKVSQFIIQSAVSIVKSKEGEVTQARVQNDAQQREIRELTKQVTLRRFKSERDGHSTESPAFLINHVQDMLAEQNRQIRKVTHQRDVLGTTLMQRNGENDLLKMKMKVMEEVISRGKRNYSDRVSDIQILSFEVGKLKKKIIQIEDSHRLKQARNQNSCTMEIQNAELQRKKCEDLLLLNIHPVRALKVKDISKFELIQKNIHLTKRLVVRTEEAIGVQKELTEKADVMLEMQTLLQRRVDVSLSREMFEAKFAVRKKTKALKAMTAEYNMTKNELSKEQQKTHTLRSELRHKKSHNIRWV